MSFYVRFVFVLMFSCWRILVENSQKCTKLLQVLLYAVSVVERHTYFGLKFYAGWHTMAWLCTNKSTTTALFTLESWGIHRVYYPIVLHFMLYNIIAIKQSKDNNEIPILYTLWKWNCLYIKLGMGTNFITEGFAQKNVHENFFGLYSNYFWIIISSLLF